MSLPETSRIQELGPEFQASIGGWIDEKWPALMARFDEVKDDALATAFMEQLAGGGRVAAFLGLTPRHIEALLVHGHSLMKAGQPAKARGIFKFITMVDPYEHRAIYAGAATFQLEGQLDAARAMYMAYITQRPNASNGFLRIAECLLAQGAAEDAAEHLEVAALNAEEEADAEALTYARTLLAKIRLPAQASPS